MAGTDRDGFLDPNTTRVSDAIVETRTDQPLQNRLQRAELWLLVDAPRWGLAAGVYGATVLVGVLGPASVEGYLLDGTAISSAYIDLQAALITVITIVLAINKLVLSPEFGPVGKQEQRLEDILTHRRAVEETADLLESPRAPPQFLRSITDATVDHLRTLDEAIPEGDQRDVDRELAVCIQDIRDDIAPVRDALDAQRFAQIGLFGVAIHFNTNRHIHRIRRIRRTYDGKFTEPQSEPLVALLTALKQFEVAREYFRTRYLQTQFIRFSNAILFTGLPALLVAHYTVGIIGPDVLVGTTFGVRNLLWFEAGTFTVTMVPVLVIVSFVARIVTLAKTSIFIGPFSARNSAE